MLEDKIESDLRGKTPTLWINPAWLPIEEVGRICRFHRTIYSTPSAV